jgi:hypothetical protein
MAGVLATDSPGHGVARWLLGDPDTLQPPAEVLIDSVGQRGEGAWRERLLAVEAMRVAHLNAEERAATASALASAVLGTDVVPAAGAMARAGHATMQTFAALVIGFGLFALTGTIYGLISVAGGRLPLLPLWKAAELLLYAGSALAGIGIVCAFPTTLLLDARRHRRWRQLAAVTLGLLGGPDSVSALASLAAADAERRNAAVWTAYRRALPTLRERDYGHLRPRATRDLCATLAGIGAEPDDQSMTMELLRALEAAGEGSGFEAVMRFAEEPRSTAEVTLAARRAAKILEERFHAERQSARLLRGAAPPDESRSLMRPVESASHDSAVLPRPAEESRPATLHGAPE